MYSNSFPAASRCPAFRARARARASELLCLPEEVVLECSTPGAFWDAEQQNSAALLSKARDWAFIYVGGKDHSGRAGKEHKDQDFLSVTKI